MEHVVVDAKTGQRKVIPFTAKEVTDWTARMAAQIEAPNPPSLEDRVAHLEAQITTLLGK